MNDLIQAARIFFSVTGSAYCLWIVWQYRRPLRPATAGESKPCRGWKAAAGWEGLCLFLFAGAFLAVALGLLASDARRVLTARQQGEPTGDHSQQPLGPTVLPGIPEVIVDVGTTRVGNPIIGIDCAFRPISDAHLREMLRVAPMLEWLTLTGTAVTDRGACDLSRMHSLRILNLGHTSVGDATAPTLARLASVKVLHLDGTRVTDRTLESLAGLPNLRTLGLSGTAITDEGLKRLHRMKNLERIFVADAETTRQGIRELQAALPDLQIMDLIDR